MGDEENVEILEQEGGQAPAIVEADRPTELVPDSKLFPRSHDKRVSVSVAAVGEQGEGR